MMTIPKNLLIDLPDQIDGEHFDELVKNSKLRIERIVSNESTEAAPWQQQVWDEWVLLLSGKAQVEFDSGEIHTLINGTQMLIPKDTRHRVLKIERKTIWLAVHFQSDEE